MSAKPTPGPFAGINREGVPTLKSLGSGGSVLTKEIVEKAFKKMFKPVNPRPLTRLPGYWGKSETTAKSCPIKKVCFRIVDPKRHKYEACIFYRQSSMPKGKRGTGPVTVVCCVPKR